MSQLASSDQLRAAFLRWTLVLSPGLLFLGFIAGAAADSGPDNPWFNALVKPAMYPPPAAFGIVWSILYILMGVALAMVITARGAPLRMAAIATFAVQFALNLGWTPLFFAMHQITAALVLMLVLLLALIVTIVLFWKVRPRAALLLLPYLAWACFATALNWQFLQANPDADGQFVSGAAARVEF